MITLITGLPGNGKTLYALNYIKAYAEKEKREVYYSGIKDLILPWTEIKAEDWMTMPSGAIIVIDECQFVFPRKPNGSKLPEHYEKLAVHRHKGFDIFLITQHPGLVDNFVRQLCGRHLHLIRKFGMQRANVWEWQAVNTSPEKAASHKTAILHKFRYPKEVYGYYKSAEVHTVKRSIPAKLVLAVLFVVAVPSFGYYQLKRYQERRGVAAAPADGAAQGQSAGGVMPAKPSYVDPVADAKQYAFNETPRVVGLPHTAPKYDEVTKPITAPVPAACVESKTRCTCYTQQATPMIVAEAVCHQIVHNGYFQDFDDGNAKRTQTAVAALNRDDGQLPISKAQTRDVAAVMSADGYGLLGKKGAGVREREADSGSMQSASPDEVSRPRVPAGSRWRAS